MTCKRFAGIVRCRAALVYLAIPIALGVGLTACSDDDEPSGWSYPTSDAGHEASDGSLDITVDRDDGALDGRDVEDEDVSDEDTSYADVEAETDTGQEDADLAPCPEDMVLIEGVCIDRYEAPNREGALPLVMFHFDEAASWCAVRDKRLCFDDEWTRACGGPEGLAYPYGDTQEPGVCNDDMTWLPYNQDALNLWPWSLDTNAIETLDELLDAARAAGAGGTTAANHVQSLYQGASSGSNPACTFGEGAYDLTGNVEEWTRRRSGETDGFHGNLKGRYWADTRTCQNSITTHGDQFRFYEIGFRCCRDPE